MNEELVAAVHNKTMQEALFPSFNFNVDQL